MAAPRVLDPVLGLVERVDRRRRHIVPARAHGTLGIERGVRRGRAVTLADGTVVEPGDPLWTIHFDNARVRQLANDDWQSAGFAAAREDLRAMAVRLPRLPEASRPVALTGVTLLWPLARRVGCEVRERRRTPWVRLEDWYLRSLLARWSRQGRARLGHGHKSLRSREVWISTAELLRRYGEPPPL